MVNKILEKVISKLIAKKLGVKNTFKLYDISVTSNKEGTSDIGVTFIITVNNDDVLNLVDKIS